jgi:hypothetical protein
MKNIHIIPTDKPSRLFYSGNSSKLTLNKYSVLFRVSPQNIYITSSNADINENDYIITKDVKLVQVSYLFSKDLEGASKVILTTDQDLIKDGVQVIDDEFLEWFIKNPSCEEVEVQKWSSLAECGYSYHIIIPKEEPKERLKKILGKKHPKQETLEEAANRLFYTVGNEGISSIESFINGAKWQQEQDKNKYSEEDMIKALCMKKDGVSVDSIIEQFKNK